MSNTALYDHKTLIEERLNGLIQVKKTPHAKLFEAAKYSLLLPGKRLRPLLVLGVLKDNKKPISWGLDPACALEWIHTYSLIHDDLPCMDDDDFRRGKPTLHKIYGEGHAVLTGDYLLTEAFHILASAPFLTPDQKLRIIDLVSLRSGGDGMIGGQAVDLLSEGQKITKETLAFIHSNKTAALFSLALEMGSIIAELDEAQSLELKKCGFALGMGFQIADDIFDEDQSDLSNKKSTYLTMYTKKEAKELTCGYFEEALSYLSTSPTLKKLVLSCYSTAIKISTSASLGF